MSHDELRELLAGAVGGLHTMQDEHFGISIVEYMAAGARAWCCCVHEVNAVACCVCGNPGACQTLPIHKTPDFSMLRTASSHRGRPRPRSRCTGSMSAF